jgi:hypothetical protein
MKRKAIHSIIVIAVIVFAFFLWYVPSHTWSAKSMDGASGEGFGPSGRGVGVSTATWNSLSGLTVEEIVVRYSSTNDARADFEFELKNGGTVVQRTDDTTGDRQRAVKVLGDANSGTSEIISRSGPKLTFVKARALKYALAFENSLLKF